MTSDDQFYLPSSTATGFRVIRATGCDVFREDIRRPASCVSGYIVVGPLTLLAGLHDPRFDKDLHVVGKSRLTDVQKLQQLTGALLTGAEKKQDLKTVLVTKRFEDYCVVAE